MKPIVAGYGHHPNSLESLVQGNDAKSKAFRKKLGWTEKEARAKLRAYRKETTIQARAMERWYFEEVAQRRER